MHHSLYSDGNTKKISWVIETNNSIIEQNREHADIYKNKVTDMQSKFIALHVGLFWGIGTFIIKNEDTIKIKFDEKLMCEYFTLNLKNNDQLIKKEFNSLNN